MDLLKSTALALATMLATLFLYNSLLPPISTLMMARTLTFRSIHRDYTPLSRISPNLVRAVIAAEDGKFCSHHGVDWQALGKVVERFTDEGDSPLHGASTITMQTAKNLFLWHGFSYPRKLVEIPLALMLDGVWSKKRIMGRYLNIAEFGPGLFGADAAARHYFGKSARYLTPREAALLAATLPNPKRRNPARPSSYVSNYASRIEARVWQQDTSCLR